MVKRFKSYKNNSIKENIQLALLQDNENKVNNCICDETDSECKCDETSDDFQEVGGFLSYNEYENQNNGSDIAPQIKDQYQDYIDEVPFKAIPTGAIVSTDIEIPFKIDDELKLNIPSFDPSYTSTPRDCSVVKCMTDKGMRIGVIYSCDLEVGLEELCSNVTLSDALNNANNYATTQNLPIYNHKTETFIGAVPTCLIIKPKVDVSTSYKK